MSCILERLCIHADCTAVKDTQVLWGYCTSWFKIVFNSWRSWLRHYATNRRFRVRFPMLSLEFFIDNNPSGHGVDPASNRNEYQGCLHRGRWVNATGA